MDEPIVGGARYDIAYVKEMVKPLKPEHVPILEEIVATMTEEQIHDLACRMPYDARAVEKIQPSMGARTWNEERWHLAIKGEANPNARPDLGGPLSRPYKLPFHKVLAYFAAASERYYGKALTEMYEIAKQKKELLDRMLAIVTQVKPFPLLVEHMYGPREEAKKVTNALFGKADEQPEDAP